jgi:hypothetical protein
MTLGFVIWDTLWVGSAIALNLFKSNLASVAFVVLSILTRLDHPFSPDIFQWHDVGWWDCDFWDCATLLSWIR